MTKAKSYVTTPAPMSAAGQTLKSTPPRRAFLSGSGALLAGVTGFLAAPGASSAVATPDADVIRLSAEYYRLEQAWRGALMSFPDTIQGDRDSAALLTPIRDRQNEIADMIEGMPSPQTLAGFQALARGLSFSTDEALCGEVEFTAAERLLLGKLLQGLVEVRA
jgi:hypothetical protein